MNDIAQINPVEGTLDVISRVAQINLTAAQKLMEISTSEFQDGWDRAQRYMQELREATDLESLTELQRSTAESTMQCLQNQWQARQTVLQDAATQTSDAIRGAFSGEDAQESAPQTEQVQPAAVVKLAPPVVEAAPVVAEAQDLTQISGIGPVFAAKLNDLGITTFAQIAQLDLAELAREDHPLHAVRTRVESDDWIAQANELIG